MKHLNDLQDTAATLPFSGISRSARRQRFVVARSAIRFVVARSAIHASNPSISALALFPARGWRRGKSGIIRSMKKQCFAAAALALASVACFGYESHVDGIIARVSENVARIKATRPDAVPMAFWDFDGTIIKGDISEGLEEGGRVLFKGLIERTIEEGLCPTYGKDGGWNRYIKRDYPAMKEIGLWLAWPYNAQMYNGQRASVLDSFCRSECERVYRKWYFDSSVRILKALERAGVENYIVSASPEMFVRAAADTLGLPSCRFVGIRVAIDGDMVTSRVVHPLPMGEGKVENVRALVLSRPHGVAVAAFGNSYSTDGAFLRYVATQPSLPGGAKGTAVMINGGADRQGYSEHFIKVEQNATVAEP